MIANPPQLISDLTDEEFEQRTLDVIKRELGLGGLARFIMTYRSGRGDYTAERHQWLNGTTLEDLERELLQMYPSTSVSEKQSAL